jgi:hypothetical protein
MVISLHASFLACERAAPYEFCTRCGVAVVATLALVVFGATPAPPDSFRSAASLSSCAALRCCSELAYESRSCCGVAVVFWGGAGGGWRRHRRQPNPSMVVGLNIKQPNAIINIAIIMSTGLISIFLYYI